MNYTISLHAVTELALRKIPRATLDAVMQNPQQIVPEQRGRKAYQSQIKFDDDRIFLVRANSG